MGLFDSVFGGLESSKTFSREEAYAGILVGATACDGHIADEEVQGLFTVLARMKLYQKFTEKHWSTMMNRLLGVLKRDGVEELVQRSSQALPAELRQTAFANACDMVLADGVVEQAEKEFLASLQRALGIPGDEALTIVQVMITKNKG